MASMSAPVAEASNGLLSTVFEIVHPASIPSDGSDHKVGRRPHPLARLLDQQRLIRGVRIWARCKGR